MPSAGKKLVGAVAILPVLMVLGAVLAVCTVAERMGLDGVPDFAQGGWA